MRLLGFPAAGVAAALLSVASPAAAQRSSRDWSPDERTVIGDFTHITAVAAGSDRVFITSPTALLVWSPLFQRWEGPFQPPDADLLRRVFVGLVDPLDNTLWLARPDGWIHYQPDLRMWDRGIAPATIRELAFDLDNPIGGVFLRTANGWFNVPRGGGAALPSQAPARPYRATTVEEAIRANPSLQANSAQILFDARARNVRYTAASRAFDRRGWFIGTWGLGLLYLPEGAALPERLAFGVPGERVGAVFAAPGGVWVATDRTAESDAALTYVAADLSEFRSVRGSPTLGLPFNQTRAIVGQGASLWVATDVGVAKVDPASGRAQVIDEGRGLPDSRVVALVSRRGVVTAGTMRGIARVTDSLEVERIAPGFADVAYAVAPAGDTVWVGTGAGVYAALPGQETLSRPRSIGASASLQVAVIGLRFMGDTLVALTRDQMLWRNPKDGQWSAAPTLSAILGRLRAFVPNGDGFWVAGERGLAYARLNTPPLRPLLGGDHPGEIRDLAVDAEHLWVATDAGLVRWQLRAIRP